MRGMRAAFRLASGAHRAVFRLRFLGKKVSNRILYMSLYEGNGDDSGMNLIVLGVLMPLRRQACPEGYET